MGCTKVSEENLVIIASQVSDRQFLAFAPKDKVGEGAAMETMQPGRGLQAA